MLTWTRLVDHACRRQEAVVLGPTALRLAVCGLDVTVERIEAAGAPPLCCARLSVRLLPEALGDPRSLLRAAAAMPIGSIVLERDDYVFRHVLPLSWTEERQIDEVAQYLARLGGALRAHLRAAPERAAVCFDNYAA
jgi:hypothetical protein